MDNSIISQFDDLEEDMARAKHLLDDIQTHLYNMSETDWDRFKDRRYLCELKQELADKCVEAGTDLSSHNSAASYDSDATKAEERVKTEMTCSKCQDLAQVSYNDGPGHYKCIPCDFEWKTPKWHEWNAQFQQQQNLQAILI